MGVIWLGSGGGTIIVFNELTLYIVFIYVYVRQIHNILYGIGVNLVAVEAEIFNFFI